MNSRIEGVEQRSDQIIGHQVDNIVELSILLCCPINVPPEQRLDEIPNRGLRVASYVRRGPELLEDGRVHIIRRVREPQACRVGPTHCPNRGGTG